MLWRLCARLDPTRAPCAALSLSLSMMTMTMMLMPMRFRRQGLRFGAGDPSRTAGRSTWRCARARSRMRCAAQRPSRCRGGPQSASLPRPLREAGRRCACARAAGHGQLARFQACGAVPWARAHPSRLARLPGPARPATLGVGPHRAADSRTCAARLAQPCRLRSARCECGSRYWPANVGHGIDSRTYRSFRPPCPLVSLSHSLSARV